MNSLGKYNIIIVITRSGRASGDETQMSGPSRNSPWARGASRTQGTRQNCSFLQKSHAGAAGFFHRPSRGGFVGWRNSHIYLRGWGMPPQHAVRPSSGQGRLTITVLIIPEFIKDRTSKPSKADYANRQSEGTTTNWPTSVIKLTIQTRPSKLQVLTSTISRKFL